MNAKRVVVRGRVQGVGFRFWMIDKAREVNVVGWVRNRHDGAVEAFLQGAPSSVERMVEWSKRGPPGARVTDIEATDTSPDPGLRDFTQRSSA